MSVITRWITFFAIATLVSLFAMVMRVKEFINQLRAHRDELNVLEGMQTLEATKLKTHRQRLLETTREMHMIYASLLLGLAECLPLGILQRMITPVSEYMKPVFVQIYACVQLCTRCVWEKWTSCLRSPWLRRGSCSSGLSPVLSALVKLFFLQQQQHVRISSVTCL